MTLEPPPDRELWTRARDGDERAFGELFDRHSRTIYNYCFRRTADWSAAEDLTSVVFMETWRRRAKVRLSADLLLPWLYGVAANVLHNHRRSLRRHRAALERVRARPTAPNDAATAAARLEAEREMRAVLGSIKNLSRNDQEILALCVWEGLGYAEAAAALGIPVGTVRSRLARARKRLRQYTEPDRADGHRRAEQAATFLGKEAS
ncbi:RNA polymerase sigma factor [Actinomadura xylanilytica]|uniref:RNA polymerase sigma factor n=1 Tax=Actinomadura xylanilytica TaxID=887459 RepID=UPI00255B0DF6|nr:RNA polymerase sigma factor [Actinomadura xylanilytica]MDL4773744.1 RNA polymerase sigma factor [Actinomadura xylanilytica]